MMRSEQDERVLSLKFENGEFEKNVSQSLGTLDKLSEKLKFKGTADAFAGIDKAAKNLTFDGVTDACNKARNSFSLMEAVGFSVINNLTNKAVDMGLKFAKSMSIDQMTAGWSKYETKTTAVQSLMSATYKNFIEEQGLTREQQLDQITARIEKLQWFADETSYSLTDMVDGISKFVGAGQDLDVSVDALEGIATWAANTGVNAQGASRAMRELAQAMGKGYVNQQDFNSIQTLTMDTIEFKQAAIEAAVATGSLIDAGNGMYRTLQGNEVSAENFRENLKDGWFTANALTQVLGKYGGFATKLNEVYTQFEGTWDTTSDLIEVIDAYTDAAGDAVTQQEILTEALGDTAKVGDETYNSFKESLDLLSSPEYDLGRRSFAAAQEYKTLSDAISATTEAVQTNWMNTFELLFGNYMEGKRVWKLMGDTLWDIFASTHSQFNDQLKIWHESGAYDELWDSMEMGLKNVSSLIDAVGAGFRKVFVGNKDFIIEAADLQKLTRNIGNAIKTFNSNLKKPIDGLKDGASILDKLTDISTGFFSVVKVGLGVITTGFKFLKALAGPVITFISEVFTTVALVVAKLGRTINNQVESFNGIKIRRALDWVTLKANTLSLYIRRMFENIRNAGRKISDNLDEIINKLKVKLKPVLDVVSRAFTAAFDGLGVVLKSVLYAIVGAFKLLKDFGVSAVEKINEVREKIKGTEQFQKFVESLIKMKESLNGIKTAAIEKIQKFFSEHKIALPHIDWAQLLAKSLETVAGWLDKIREFFGKVGEVSSKVFGKIKTSLSGLKGMNPGEIFIASIDFSKGIGKTIVNSIKNIDWKKSFEDLKGVGKHIVDSIWSGLSNITFEGLLSTAAKGSFIYILFNLGKTLLNIGKGAKSARQGIKKIANSLTDSFESMSKVFDSMALNNKADAAKKFAEAIAIIVGAIAVLTFLNQSKVKEAVTNIGAISLVVAGVVALTSLISKANNEKKKIKTLKEIGDALNNGLSSIGKAIKKGLNFIGLGITIGAIGTTLLMFTNIMIKLSKEVIPDNVKTNLFTMGKALVLMVGIIALINSIANVLSPDSAKSWVGIGVTILAVGSAVKQISNAAVYLKYVDADTLNKKLRAIGLFLTGIIGIATISHKLGGVGSGLSFLALVAGLKLLGNTLNDFFKITDNSTKSKFEQFSEALANGIHDIGVSLKNIGIPMQSILIIGTVLLPFVLYALSKCTPALLALGVASLSLAGSIAILSKTLPDFAEGFGKLLEVASAHAMDIVNLIATIAVGAITAISASKHKIATAAIGLVVAILTELHSKGPEFSHNLFMLIKDIALELASYADDIADIFGSVVIKILDSITLMVKTHGKGIVESAGNLMDAIGDLAGEIVNQFTGIDKGFASTIGRIGVKGGVGVTVLSKLAKAFLKTGKSASDSNKDVKETTSLLDRLKDKFGIFNTFKTTYSNISNIIKPILSNTKDFIGLLANGNGLIESIVTLVGVSDGFMGVLASIAGIALPIVAAVGGIGLAIKVASDQVKDATEKMYGFKSANSELIDSINLAAENRAYNNEQLANNLVHLDDESERIEQLVEEYNSLIDANGKVVEGEEVHAQNIKDELSKYLGIYGDDLDKLYIKNGLLKESIYDVINAQKGQSYLSEMEDDYKQALDDRVHALSNYYAASELFKEKGDPIANLANANPVIQQIIDFAPKFTKATGMYAENYDNIYLYYQAVGRYMEGIDESFRNSGIMSIYDDLESYYDDCVIIAEDAKQVLENAGNQLDEVNTIISNYEGLQKAVISGDSKAIDEYLNKIDIWKSSFATMTSEESKEFSSMIDSLISDLNNPNLKLNIDTEGAKSAIGSTLEEYAKAIIKGGESGSESAMAFSDSMLSVLQEQNPVLSSELIDIFNLNPGTFDETTQAAISEYINSLNNSISNGSGGFSEVTHGLVNLTYGSVKDWIKQENIGADSANAFTANTKAALDSDSTVADSAYNVIERAEIKAAGLDVSGVGGGFTDDISDGMTAKAKLNAVGASGDMVAVAAKTAAGKVSFQIIGANAALGFGIGMEHMIGRVRSSAATIAGAAAERLKSFLGIHSPSRLFREYGEYTGEGFALGVEDSEHQVMSSTASLAKRALDAMEDPLSKIQELAESDYQYCPTITPVLDLSGIQNGSTMINSMLNDANANLALTARGTLDPSDNVDLVTMMNDALESTLEKFMNGYSDAQSKEPIVIEVPLALNGRQIAKATATYTKEELDTIEKFADRRGGNR